MRMKGSTDNRMLYGVLAAGAAMIVIVVAFGFGGGSEAERLKSFTLPCRIEPAWNGAAESGGAGEPDSSAPRGILVYLDTSHPMGGYLPPAGVEAEPAFRAVAQLLPGHLVGRFAGVVEWLAVDATLRRLEGNLSLTRSLFTGGQTRLDLALGDLVNALEAGSAEAAVLVTDLVSTSGPEGAMGAVEPILRWNRTVGVRQRQLDLGLLAVRADYWGVSSSRCTGTGSLGCWYSEHANRYVPMTEPAKRPLYFLFFGTSGGGDGGGSRVEEAARSFQESLDDLGFETRWELLTRGSRGRPGALLCSASRVGGSTGEPEAQFALVRNGDGRHECRRDEKVLLSCCVATGEAGGEEISCAENGISLRSADSSWPEVAVRAEGGRLEVVVDCESLRRKKPDGPLLFENVRASLERDEPGSWREWSERSDEVEATLNGTLQLDLFVETTRLRPDHYRMDVQEPVLRFAP